MVTTHHNHHGKKVGKQRLSVAEHLARLFVGLLGLTIGVALIYLIVARFF